MNDISREFLAERDARIMDAKLTGASDAVIARKFDMTPRQVNAAVQRQLTKNSQEALLAYPEALAMELQRLDRLMQALWPMTQVRQVEVDGEVVTLEPDLKATDQVMKIMAQRQKLLGMDIQRQEVLTTSVSGPDVRSTLHGRQNDDVHAVDPKDEALALMRKMQETGVVPIPEEMLALAAGEEEVIDADVVDEADPVVSEEPVVEPLTDDG